MRPNVVSKFRAVLVLALAACTAAPNAVPIAGTPVRTAGAREPDSNRYTSYPAEQTKRFPAIGFLNVGGTLYGAAASGGYGNGRIFAFDPATRATRIVYDFASWQQGSNPQGTLLPVGDELYGTTYEGGTYGLGVLYSVNAATGVERVLHSFGRGDDGASPVGGVVDVNGILYGTTAFGGSRRPPSDQNGTLYRFDLATGAERVVYRFRRGTDGANPENTLLRVGRLLYGTTYEGGGSSHCSATEGCGTVFRFDPATDGERVLHAFNVDAPDGAAPLGSLLYVNGLLYGTTPISGTLGYGVLYGMTLEGSETVLYNFGASRADAALPTAGVLERHGSLFGTTSAGGGSASCSYGCGTVYRFDLATESEHVVHRFGLLANHRDGAEPRDGLLLFDNVLYGTTLLGGPGCAQSAGCGTLFSLGI